MFLCAVVLAALPAMSQTQPGSFEFSAAGNIGSLSTSTETTSGAQTNMYEPEAQSYFGLDIRVGAYLVEGLSIEPEIYILAVEKSPPAFNLGGNLSYTFTIPESPVKPFVIAGYGVGNGIPVMQRLMGRASDKLDIPVLRVGGGLKFFLSKQVAVKIEYRYERYTTESTTSYYYYSYSYKEVQNYHNVLFGFSVFLPAAQ
jgi:hypothetical protein